jgi:PAS domain S-box-containing protein
MSTTTPPNYNLVERKKRKNRGGHKNGPQDGFIFHLKLEEEKKSKRQKNQQNQQRGVQGPSTNQYAPQPTYDPPPHLQNLQQQIQPPYTVQNYTPTDSIPFLFTPTVDHTHTVVLENSRDNKVVAGILSRLDTVSSPSMLCCTDGCIIKVNDDFSKIIGYTSEELESTMLQNFSHPDDKVASNILVLQLIASNSDSVTHDVRYVTPEGKVVFVVQEVMGIRNIHGHFQWLVYKITKEGSLGEIVGHDRMRIQNCYCNHKISNQSLIVDEVDHSFEEMFGNALERFFHLAQPCCFYDLTATILWNNDSFDQLFGGKPKQFVNKKTTEIDEMKGTAMDILAKSVLEEQPEKLECQFVPQITDPVKKMAVKCCGQRIDKGDGSLLGYLWIFEILDPSENQGSELIFKEDLKL